MKICSVLLLLLIFGLAKGQAPVPAMGEIDKEDLQMTSCSLDPEADAYILLKTGETSFSRDPDIRMQTVYRLRIKILQDKAVGRGNVKINFFSTNDFQSISDVHGITYNLDESGNVVHTELAKSNIYRKDISKDMSEVAFTLPDVRKGSVIEYSYILTSRNFADIDNWYFQDAIPTRYSRFFFSVPSYLGFTYHIHRILPMKEESVSMPEAGKYFTMENIPGLKEEPYMSAARDYLQYIDFQLSALSMPGMTRNVRHTWADLNTELLQHEMLGSQLHKKIDNISDLEMTLKGVADSVARMDTVYNYVRRHMDWNQQYGLFSKAGIKAAWENKSGSVADINLILVDLLKQAGLRAYPLLVSTRRHGRVNRFYPLLTQFNELLTYVLIGDQRFVLDGMDKFTPPGLVPFDVQNSVGFVLDRKYNGFVDLSDTKDPFRIMAVVNAHLRTNGVVRGDASVYNYGYSKVPRCKRLDEGLERFKNYYFTKPYARINVDSLTVTGQSDDSLPLDQEFNFSMPLSGTGDYLLFTPNIFLGLEKNPFTSEHRFSDVDFGYQQFFMVSGSLTIPEGYHFETLPKNLKLIMQDTSIELERVMVLDSNRVDYRIQLRFNQPIYDVTAYDSFKEFYKKLFATLNDPIVIRKKNN